MSPGDRSYPNTNLVLHDNILAIFVDDGDTAVPSSAWGDTSSPDNFEASSSPERTESIDERKGNAKEQQPIAKEGNAKEQQPIAKLSLRQQEKKKEYVSPARLLSSSRKEVDVTILKARDRTVNHWSKKMVRTNAAAST